MYSIRTSKTFTTEACRETFKAYSGPFNSNLKKLFYLFNLKACAEALYVGKAKTKFQYRFNNFISKHRAYRKVNQKILEKLFRHHYYLDGHFGIDGWDFILFEQNLIYK